jgi:hypothetical protein
MILMYFHVLPHDMGSKVKRMNDGSIVIGKQTRLSFSIESLEIGSYPLNCIMADLVE